MTLYDLNFWEEPDWSRESSVSPVFTFGATVALFIVIGLGVVTSEQRQLQDKVKILAALNRQNTPLKPQAMQANKVKKQITTWQKAVTFYQASGNKNFAWSSQLETIERLIPDTIILTSLSMRTNRGNDVMGGEKNTYTLPDWTAVVTIEGIAGGSKAYQTITTLIDKLANDKLLSQVMEPKLVQTTAEGKKKKFKIDLRYMAR